MSEEEERKNNSEILFNIDKASNFFGKAKKFFCQKKVINAIIIILFLFLLIGSSGMRLQNLDLLKDSTTGKYIPLALDPFYFLRLAETIQDQGSLPDFDSMRYLPLKVGFSKEIGPQAVVLLYKIISVFDKETTVAFADVISPVIFFALGLIVFFFLIYVLTNSKTTALLSSGFLAVIPLYLHRTMAGFSDHEAIGMFAFFLVMLVYALGLKFLEKENKSLMKTVLFGLFIGFLTAFTIVSWGGIATFVFMIIPLSFLIFWFLKVQNQEELNKKSLFNCLIFYIIWFFSSIIFSLPYGISLSSAIGKVTLSTSSLINGAVLLFIIVDYFLILKRNILKEKLRKFRILISLGVVVIIGSIFLVLSGENLISFFVDIFNRLLNPFGVGRTGLTVAENARPYLNQFISQISKIFFWLFYLGLIFLGIEMSKGISKKKNRVLFSFFWILMVSGILFSRISSGSLLNGTSFISKFIYFSGLILFFGYAAKIYFRDEIKIKSELILIFSWVFFMLVSGMGAVRFFFFIAPFVVFMACFFVVKLFDYSRETKDDFFRTIFVISLIFAVVGLIISGTAFVKSSSFQAENTGPSANFQWQNSMKWVRDNTPQDSIFVHWWDYGYWIQYLGQRPTVTDGGHANGFWDHLIGRYLLTTTKPETALSFMKSQNVSYLLIDPTDLGKYPAYSKIGSDDTGGDRLSQIPIMLLDPNRIQKSENGTLRIYQGGAAVDEDIIYKEGENEIFLPKNNAIVAGVILETALEGGLVTFSQPKGIFIYNQKQITLPLRYVYFEDRIMDFVTGVDAIVRIIPSAGQNNQQIQIDKMGAVIYLSPKVSKSFFAQLYLLNDVFDNYETIKLVHSQPDQVVSSFGSQGANFGEFIFFQGFRGPIKIWEVSYPSNILAKEEFIRLNGEYAEFDDLKFVI